MVRREWGWGRVERGDRDLFRHRCASLHVVLTAGDVTVVLTRPVRRAAGWRLMIRAKGGGQKRGRMAEE